MHNREKGKFIEVKQHISSAEAIKYFVVYIH